LGEEEGEEEADAAAACYEDGVGWGGVVGVEAICLRAVGRGGVCCCHGGRCFDSELRAQWVLSVEAAPICRDSPHQGIAPPNPIDPCISDILGRHCCRTVVLDVSGACCAFGGSGAVMVGGRSAGNRLVKVPPPWANSRRAGKLV
jgi:hypothetical protein